jgi:hypothetical protein
MDQPMSDTQLVILIAVAFPIFFSVMWIGVVSLLSITGGWRGLARRFPAVPDQYGEHFRGVTASFRQHVVPVNYKHVLQVGIGQIGLGLSVPWMFIIMHPPITLPWSEMESCEPAMTLFWPSTRVRLKGGGTIGFVGKAGTAILVAWQSMHPTAPAAGATP